MENSEAEKGLPDLVISGVRLGQEGSTLQHLLDLDACSKHVVGSGLEQWNFLHGRSDPGYPSSIKLLDGKVIEVNGLNMTVGRHTFSRESDEKGIEKVMEFFGFRRTSEHIKKALCFRKDAVDLFISTRRPLTKSYSMSDMKSEYLWTSRHRHGKNC
ncbi:MAG: hypothetical protein WC314_08230 [Vulcanimicrobiota bacterium]